MTEELRRELLGGRIQKINQPFEQELVLQVRSNRKSHKLLLSAHSVFGRVQLTETTFENPAVPNTFIMVMRKYLQGAVIEAIQQVENDRILEVSVSNKNEIGDSVAVTLVIEIMGKHSNIILLDKASGKIIEAIKHVGFSQNSYRTILPGSTYVAPPQTGSLNPFTVGDEKLFQILQTEDLEPKRLQQMFQGLGRDTATELSGHLAADKLKTFRAFFASPTQPSLTEKSFSALLFSDSKTQMSSLSELLDTFYKDKAERDRVNQQASELIRRVENELEKNRKKLGKQEEELLATENAEEFRQKRRTLDHLPPSGAQRSGSGGAGQLLHGWEDCHCTWQGSDPKSKCPTLFQTLPEAQGSRQTPDQLNWGDTDYDSLPRERGNSPCSGQPDWNCGNPRGTHPDWLYPPTPERKIQKRQKPEKYLATDGQTIILVGRNNLQNDELTFKMAKKDELWFHAKDIPGSHVVITGNLQPSDEVKTDAAELAAYFSKARLSNLVQVDMIEAKNSTSQLVASPDLSPIQARKPCASHQMKKRLKAWKCKLSSF